MWLFTSSKTNLKKDKSSEDEDPFFELAKELDANQSNILSFALDTAVIAKASALEKHVTNHKDKLNWDFLQKTVSNKSSVLHLFCLFGLSSLVKAILKSIIQTPPFPWKVIWTKDSRGMTALHCAAFIVHDNSMVFASKKDKKAKEKAMSSLWEKKEKIVEFMVTNKELALDIFAKDDAGNLFLHYFVPNGVRVTKISSKSSLTSHFTTALKLSLNEKSCNVQNNEGNTFMHPLLQENSTEHICLKIVLLCLQAHANPNLQNSERDTCLILAMRKGYGKIVSALLDHWADYTIIGRNNFSAVQMTKLISFPDIAKTLSGTVAKESQKPFSVLPRGILLRILHYLTARELCHMSQVCKYLCRVCNDEVIWRDLSDHREANENCWKSFYRHTTSPVAKKTISTKLSLNQEAFVKLLQKYQGNFPLESPTLNRPSPEHRPPSRRGSLTLSQDIIGALDEKPEPESRKPSIIPIVASDSPVIRTTTAHPMRRTDAVPIPVRLSSTLKPSKSHDIIVDAPLLSPLLSRIPDPSASPPSPAVVSDNTTFFIENVQLGKIQRFSN